MKALLMASHETRLLSGLLSAESIITASTRQTKAATRKSWDRLASDLHKEEQLGILYPITI